jgi:hypothetical protein
MLVSRIIAVSAEGFYSHLGVAKRKLVQGRLLLIVLVVLVLVVGVATFYRYATETLIVFVELERWCNSI